MGPTAIPTRYAGTEFRSRLEARWAAFFDLVGWRWEYEPIDLPGWIPDFMLIGASTVLVEVKPADSLQGFDLDKIRRALAGSERDGLEVLLLGRAPSLTEDRSHGEGVLLGWLLEPDHPGPEYVEGGAVYHNADRLDFCSNWGSFKGRMSGEYWGNSCVGLHPRWDRGYLDRIESMWREAGNITRWKRPRVAE